MCFVLSRLLKELLAEGKRRIAVADEQESICSYSQTPSEHANNEVKQSPGVASGEQYGEPCPDQAQHKRDTRYWIQAAVALHKSYCTFSAYFSTRAGSYGALLPLHTARGHSWQLSNVTSVGKYIPDRDFSGSIKKVSVSLTPIRFSTSPRMEKSSSC